MLRLLALVFMLAACGGGVQSVDDANLPPVGTVWFGESFDPQTFAVSGRTTNGVAGATMGVVARLSRPIEMSGANLRISLDGTTITNQATGLAGQGDVYAVTYTFPVAGQYQVQITDTGGNVLSSGTIDVR